ncbi:hypothetical protein IQ07DRAFT_638722 [Pyrenochaeta sp. DS3sAY3a]|nr:hypothetical protein IQ07DRAFT_638722 [Pyrenochaeta sp. DS3sAY3a]
MPSPVPTTVLALLTLLSLIPLCTAEVTDPATLTASIKRDRAYSLLPPCINQCLWDIGNNDARTLGGDVALQLSCSAPWPNGCYCRPQSATFAAGFIASCATRLCVDAGALPQETDVASGQAIYASYCSNALGAQYTPESVEQAAAPTPAVVPGGLSIAPASSRKTSTVPQQTGQTGPADQSSSPSGSNTNSDSQKEKRIMGLSVGAFIGVVVSIVCSILGLIFGVLFKVYKHKKEQKRQAQMHESVNGVYYTTKQG